VNGVVTVAGTVLGGFLLVHGIGFADPYHRLFVTSTAIRLLPLIGFVSLGRLGLGQVRQGLEELGMVALHPGAGVSFVLPVWLRPRGWRRRVARAGQTPKREKPRSERAGPPSRSRS
jgi:hypothetical protein